ncbi:hypothetical protein GE061_020248 [Apolygus lucorum]|uniref:Uncharacterized protein n=1 Tax=Apolygus lucorum TaxID=248454 RepID=A0A8S9WM55_APOLU|nr:hypothetical protein GE061_020248 [Apolygus lucorum]
MMDEEDLNLYILWSRDNATPHDLHEVGEHEAPMAMDPVAQPTTTSFGPDFAAVMGVMLESQQRSMSALIEGLVGTMTISFGKAISDLTNSITHLTAQAPEPGILRIASEDSTETT